MGQPQTTWAVLGRSGATWADLGRSGATWPDFAGLGLETTWYLGRPGTWGRRGMTLGELGRSRTTWANLRHPGTRVETPRLDFLLLEDQPPKYPNKKSTLYESNK